MTDTHVSAHEGCCVETVPAVGTPEHLSWAMKCGADLALPLLPSMHVTRTCMDDLQSLQASPCTQIKVVQCDSITALDSLDCTSTHIAVLDMAARHKPPGLLSSGFSQEEDLCRRTSLGEALRSAEARGAYPLPKRSAMFVRGARVTLGPGPDFTPLPVPGPPFSIIAAACDRHALQDSMELVFRVAAANSVDTLVLGAWGCGGRKLHPAEVADAFHAVLHNVQLPLPPTVLFAIPGSFAYSIFAAKL